MVSSALVSGIDDPPNLAGAATGDLRGAIISVLNAIVNFLGILVLVAIVIAGFRLVLSQGEEEAKEKAKKGIMYSIIGLILVIFAKVIILFITAMF